MKTNLLDLFVLIRLVVVMTYLRKLIPKKPTQLKVKETPKNICETKVKTLLNNNNM